MRFITPIILIVLAIGLFVWYINPTYGTITELRAEAAQYDMALNRSQELIAVRDALLSKYNMIPSNDLARLRKLLPDHVDNVRLILDMNNIAAQYGMTLANISLTETSAEGNELGADTSPLGAIEFSFSVRSTYNNFLDFLADLENSLRIVDVVNVSFTADATALSTYRVTVRTYWLK
jgi:Tfp pilus assembly protein PilO